MPPLVATMLARLLDSIIIVGGVLCDALLQTWGYVLVGVAEAGLVTEIILVAGHYTRPFQPGMLLVAVVLSAGWAWAAHRTRSHFRNRKAE